MIRNAAPICLLCGVADERPLLRRAKPRHVVCRRCGLVYQNPRPDLAEIADYYQQGYWEDRGPIDVASQPPGEVSSDRGEFVVEWARSSIGSVNRVVEIGCGGGEILAYIRDKLGCQAVGVEPSRAKSASAAKRFALEVLNSDLDGADLQGRSADVLVLSHVLEHFHEPLAALIRCRDLLADNGWIFIEVPNIMHPNSRKRLSGWLAFEHMYYFSVGTLSRLLAEAGFRVKRTATNGVVRALAQKTPTVPLPLPAAGNEYRRVLLALARHELTYWPRYAAQRAAGLFARRPIASSGPHNERDRDT